MNGHANCILAVCCPPGSDGQIQALADEMGASGMFQSMPEEQRRVALRSVAAWVLKNYDLAPPGSLQAFKESVRDLAREGYTKAG